MAGDPREFLAHGPERLTGKDALHWKSEEFADAQGEIHAGGVVSSFQATERLVVKAQCIGEIPPGEPAAGAKNGDAIEEGRRSPHCKQCIKILF
jgi:hypothetical protein